jgi:hypothetical protein
MPSTTIRPASCFSSRLMQRISVDFPEPDGPMTTTTSWRPDVHVDVLEGLEVAEELVDTLAGDHRVAGATVASESTLPGSVIAGLDPSCRYLLVPTPRRFSSRWLARDIV